MKMVKSIFRHLEKNEFFVFPLYILKKTGRALENTRTLLRWHTIGKPKSAGKYVLEEQFVKALFEVP